MKGGGHGSGHITHGLAGTVEYNAWLAAKQRCEGLTLAGYKNYGGRGIKVCERWKRSFENFLADMGRRPSVRHSLDRIDVNGNYEPGNCRWATRKEQNLNKTSSVRLTFKGKTQTATEWAQEIGVKAKTLQLRVRRGWPIERILAPSLQKRGVDYCVRKTPREAHSRNMSHQKAVARREWTLLGGTW